MASLSQDNIHVVRELRGQKCPERGQKVWRLYLTGNFALNSKINVLHAVPGKFFNGMVTNSQNI